MAKRKNSNYKYRQQKEAEAMAERERTFREKKHRTVVIINIVSIFCVIVSIVMLILFEKGLFAYGDLVLLLVCGPTMWLQGYRYQTVNPKLSKVCRIMAIFDVAFLLYTVYYKFFSGTPIA